MIKTILIASLSVVVFAACHPFRPLVTVGGDGDVAIRIAPNPKEPGVHVDVDPDSGKKRVLVDQEPIYAKAHPNASGKKLITWKLDAQYKFPETGGIEICPASKSCATKPAHPECRRQNDRTIWCTYDKPSQQNTVYFYTIRVLEGSTALDALDPTIMN